ncbi:MAG: cobalamin biosynthesis central domain-containing protein, partial [Rikenellaceae bacterium]
MERTVIVLSSGQGINLAKLITQELEGEITTISTHSLEGVTKVDRLSEWIEQNLSNYSSVIFIGAVGIAVRLIAPCITNKYSDPAVVAVDVNGNYAISLLSGHVGGANKLTRRVSQILGATPIITTRSDLDGVWALDTMGQELGWNVELQETTMNSAIATFVNKEMVALLV